jgi:hypothetical protein
MAGGKAEALPNPQGFVLQTSEIFEGLAPH